MNARGRLEAQRRDLIASIARTEAELATPVEVRGEDTTASQHPADVASDLSAHEIAILTDLTLREAVAEIDAALARILNATYGACVDCGDRVPEARLAGATPGGALRPVSDEGRAPHLRRGLTAARIVQCVQRDECDTRSLPRSPLDLRSGRTVRRSRWRSAETGVRPRGSSRRSRAHP
jgi:DnaK suppressor protein